MFPYLELDTAYTEAQQVFRLIPDSHFEDEVGQEVQERLGEVQTLTGVNRYLIGYGDEEASDFILSITGDYVENGRQIAENIVYLHDQEDFQSHEVLVENYLPPREEAENQVRFFEELQERGLDIEWNPYSSAQVLQEQLHIISGVFLFLFVALLAGDHFTKDQTNHWSVTQGVPISWKSRWRMRSLLLWLVMWATILAGLAVSYGISLLFETTGSLQYPVPYFAGGEIRYLSLWQYGVLLIGINMILSYFLLLLTTGLSWIIRNMYVTILLLLSLYFLPQVWQTLPAVSSWQPSLYMDPLGVVSGETSQMVGLQGVEFWKMSVILLGLAIGLELAFAKIFSLIPTRTMGLKRREM